MASNKCARQECGKTVYPMEELKCLDQTWHKQCFRCATCNMVLSLKSYKGHSKIPYCDAHYPKTTATVVVDTPEMRRLQEATKIQSQVKYHEDFERSKGKKLDVVDDPELQRHMKNTKIQSDVAYHGETGRKEVMEKSRPPLEETGQAGQKEPGAATDSAPSEAASNATSPTKPGALQPGGKPATPGAKSQQSPTLIYSSDKGGRVQPQGRQVGSIADYDPLNGQWGSITSTGNARQPPPGPGQKPAPTTSAQSPQGTAPSPFGAKVSPASRVGHRGPQESPGRGNQGVSYRAVYDYAAADTDEVSFKEGDVIVNCQQVDNGWMTGTVKRTGKWGMLPANYVERVH